MPITKHKIILSNIIIFVKLKCTPKKLVGVTQFSGGNRSKGLIYS